MSEDKKLFDRQALEKRLEKYSELMTKDQVAEGFEWSIKTVDAKINKGLIVPLDHCGSTRFSKSAIIDSIKPKTKNG